MYVIKERLFDIGDDFDITDDTGQKVFHVDGKALSLRDRLVIETPDGREVASVHRRLIALWRTYSIEIAGQPAADLKKKLFTPFRDSYTIDVPGPDDLTMHGDLLDHEYEVERGGDTVARVSKRWFSFRDTYAVDVAPGHDDLLILTAVLAVDLAQAADEKDKNAN